MIYRSLAVIAALALSACGMMDPQGGYRPMDRQGQPYSGAGNSGSAAHDSFDQANAECWELAYNLLGGNAMDSARTTAYNRCMNERGWENPMLPAQPRPTTTPGSR